MYAHCYSNLGAIYAKGLLSHYFITCFVNIVNGLNSGVLSSSYCVIVRVSVVPKRSVVGN